uniref:Pentapeptide repeat-containing protein n=1 Tax=Candidatus Kentrum sp. SD TaxID=2126332 RepID=A0A451BIC1_9GAMM|nr:MAG: Pentapeptide repeat-containing protein [Candidatus Kentron sp. SD]
MPRFEIIINIIKKSLWVIYNLSGARHIREIAWIKRPNAPDYEKPPTFLLWAIGLYAALYGIVATHYEAALDRVENRMDAVVSQLSTGDEQAFKNLIRQVPRIQRMETPPEPSLRWPLEGNFVLGSFLEREPNPKILQQTRETLEIWKGRLAGVNLRGINLSGARLWDARLFGAELANANLSNANLLKADLSGAHLNKANLSEARLGKADLSGAWLREANLSGARLGGILGKIKNWREIASIEDANIHGVIDAPEGFRAWALKNGAVEMAPEEWKVFRENDLERAIRDLERLASGNYSALLPRQP